MSGGKVIDICLLNIEDRGKNVFISFLETFENGAKRTVRKNVKQIGGYYDSLTPKPIDAAEYLDTVYCGVVKSDVRLLFSARLSDGSAQLIQTREGTKECLKMLELSAQEEIADDIEVSAHVEEPLQTETSYQYVKGKNMATVLGAGIYAFGKNLPNGTYDLTAVRGKGFLAPYDLEGEKMPTIWIGINDDSYARTYRGISSDDLSKFTVEGSVEFEIKKAEVIEIE